MSNEQCRKNIAKLIGSDKIELVADSSADKLEDVDSISSFDSIEGFKILSSLYSKNFDEMEKEVEADCSRDTSSTLKLSCRQPKTAYAVNDAVVAFDSNSKEFRAGKILSLQTDKECKIVFKKGESFCVPVAHVLPYNFKVTLKCPICRMKLPRYNGNARRRDLHVFEHLNKEHNQYMKTMSNTRGKRAHMKKTSMSVEVQQTPLKDSPIEEKPKVHEVPTEKTPSEGDNLRQNINIKNKIELDYAVSVPSKSNISNTLEQHHVYNQSEEWHRQVYNISKGSNFTQQKHVSAVAVTEPYANNHLYYHGHKWNQAVGGHYVAPSMPRYHEAAYEDQTVLYQKYNNVRLENKISSLTCGTAMINESRGNTFNVFIDTKLIQKIMDNELDKLTETYGVGIMANPKSLLSTMISILSADYGKAVDASQVPSLELLLHKALKQKKIKLGINLNWKAFRLGSDGKAYGY